MADLAQGAPAISEQDKVRQITELLGSDDGESGAAPRDQGDNEAANRDKVERERPGASEGDDTDTSDTVEATDQDAEAGDDQEPDQRITPSDLAAKLGLEAKDLYDELQIPLGDDKFTTLGEWKDRVKDLQDVDGARQALTEDKAEYEKGSLRDRQVLQRVVELIPPEIRDQVMAVAQEQYSGYMEQQQKVVLEAIPEWKDADKRAADRDKLVEMGQEFGFSEQEITATHDARTLRFMHEYMRLRERLSAIDVASKQKRTKPNKASAGTKQTKRGKLAAALGKAKQTGDSADQAAAISLLLQGN
jgi:hypothetical protein